MFIVTGKNIPERKNIKGTWQINFIFLPLQKNNVMTKIKNLFSTLLSVILTMVGIICIMVYLRSPETITTFIVGMVGFGITFQPAYEKWKHFFDKIINKDNLDN